MTQLEAHELPLDKVFSSDFDFRIPEYQRPYSWKTEHALQLLDDLGEALDRGDEEPYFLGSVVLVKESTQASADIIDGQQRLTTLTILLALLRDLASDDEVKRDLGLMLQEAGSKVKGLAAKPRLTLRERDAPFFQKYVQNPGFIHDLLKLKPDNLHTDSIRAVRENAKALQAALESEAWPEERRFELAQLLGQRTFLVIVSTPDLDSAYRIFSVMNARGLNLSPADIFKSKVVGPLGPDRSKEYADRWEDAEASLGHDDFGDLFTHIRMIFAKERARTTLLNEFPKQVLNRFINEGRAEEFVDNIVIPYAEAYRQIRDYTYASTVGADKINAWFRRLNGVGNSDWIPAALWAVKHHRDDPAWLDSFLCKLERLATSMLIRRVYATPRVMRYADLLRQLEDDNLGLESPAFELSSKEKTDTLHSLDGDVYLHTQGRRYLLLRLDEILANTPGVQYQYKLITVEHVLPQNPATKSKWLKDFNDNQRAEWTHKLANLVLLNRTKNSEAQNYEFDTKKSKYFSGKNGVATFALTSQVLNTPKWNPKTLEARQQELLSAMSSEWGLGELP